MVPSAMGPHARDRPFLGGRASPARVPRPMSARRGTAIGALCVSAAAAWGALERAGQPPARNARMYAVWRQVDAAAASWRGFSSRVIEATVRDQLGGYVERRWEPAGLVCEVAVPLGRVLVAANASTTGAPPAAAR